MFRSKFSLHQEKKSALPYTWQALLQDSLDEVKKTFATVYTENPSDKDSLSKQRKLSERWAEEQTGVLYDKIKSKFSSLHIDLSSNVQNEILLNSTDNFNFLLRNKLYLTHIQETCAKGACGEQSIFVFFYLLEKIREHQIDARIESVQIHAGKSNHNIVVIDRLPGSSIEDPSSWGEGCYICDPLNQIFYKLSYALNSPEDYLIKVVNDNHKQGNQSYKIRLDLNTDDLQFKDIISNNFYIYLQTLLSMLLKFKTTEDLLALPEKAIDLYDGIKLASMFSVSQEILEASLPRFAK